MYKTHPPVRVFHVNIEDATLEVFDGYRSMMSPNWYYYEGPNERWLCEDPLPKGWFLDEAEANAYFRFRCPLEYIRKSFGNIFRKLTAK